MLGQFTQSTSDFDIGHCLMSEAIDAHSVRHMLHEKFDLNVDAGKGAAVDESLVHLLAKAEASPNGQVRGSWHTMLNGSNINSTRHTRAAVGAVPALVAGHSALYVSGGAEHQGPPGGGPVVAIVRL